MKKGEMEFILKAKSEKKDEKGRIWGKDIQGRLEFQRMFRDVQDGKDQLE